jgi:hypothetical protein
MDREAQKKREYAERDAVDAKELGMGTGEVA